MSQSIPRSAGFTLVEVLIAMAIFAMIFSGAFAAYLGQLDHATREYRVAEAAIEFNVAREILSRDLAQAGYGLANDYDTLGFSPRPAAAQDGAGGDALTLMGTPLSLESRASQGWSFVQTDGTFQVWTDPLEQLRTASDAAKNDAVILMEPNSKRLLVDGTDWLFRYNGPTSNLTSLDGSTTIDLPEEGTLVYGLQRADAPAATQPYYAIKYALGGSSFPESCAPGTKSLMRVESNTSEDPDPEDGTPLMACVLDFQVAFGLDTNDDEAIDTWDNGGAVAGTYDAEALRSALKQMRVYVLLQSGSRDRSYTYPQATVRVGDANLGTGENVTLSADQRQYRWRLATISIAPRNIR